MRKHYKQTLKAFFHRKLLHSRVDDLAITQEEMASRLSMSCRSYADLDHGETSCSAVTLALYLVYVCNDPEEFLKELHNAFDAAEANAS